MGGCRQRQGGGELRAADREEGAHIANIAAAGEQPVGQLMISLHVRKLKDQHEIGAARDLITLLDARLGARDPLELPWCSAPC